MSLKVYFFRLPSNSRDITYSAPIYANIRYTRGKDELVQKDSVLIGRMPVMLRSAACVLANCNEQELARKGECPLDPGNFKGINPQHNLQRGLFYYPWHRKGDAQSRTTLQKQDHH
jgi:DNA-directed RNA polymerase beta subunit